MFNSIGCFYSFEKCVIVVAKIDNGKVILNGELFTNSSIKTIVDVLKSYPSDKVCINNQRFLNSFFNGKLRQFDFNDESSLNETIDFYKSLNSEHRLVFGNIDNRKIHELKALYLALSGININDIYQEKSEPLLATIEPFPKSRYSKRRF
jgi:hypothetical protein